MTLAMMQIMTVTKIPSTVRPIHLTDLIALLPWLYLTSMLRGTLAYRACRVPPLCTSSRSMDSDRVIPELESAGYLGLS